MKELQLKIEELEERIAPDALSMLHAWGVGAQGGMAHAMLVDNPNGNTGMSTAVANSGH